MRKFLALPALALAALLGFAVAPASAATFALGDISDSGDFLGNQIKTAGPFTDLFTFSVNNTVNDGQATIIEIGNNSVFNIDNLTLAITDAVGSFVHRGPVAVGPTGALLVINGLAGGNYAVRVTGDVTGSLGGSYTGSIYTNVVPIPGAVFLFAPALAGLAGLKRFRRKDADNDTVPAAA